MLSLNAHAAQRAAQRNLSADEIAYVLAHGQRWRRAGALFVYLRRRDVPVWDAFVDDRIRLVGTAVVLSKDGDCVLTVWRNRRTGMKRIRRKSKLDIPWQVRAAWRNS